MFRGHEGTTWPRHFYICLYLSWLTHDRLFVTPWTVSCQAPLSMETSRQEYWSGLPLPCLGQNYSGVCLFESLNKAQNDSVFIPLSYKLITAFCPQLNIRDASKGE